MADDQAVLTAIAARLKSRAPAATRSDEHSVASPSSAGKSPHRSVLVPGAPSTEVKNASIADAATGPPLFGDPERLQEARRVFNSYSSNIVRRGKAARGSSRRPVSSPVRVALQKPQYGSMSHKITPKRNSSLTTHESAGAETAKKLKTSTPVDSMEDHTLSKPSKMQDIVTSDVIKPVVTNTETEAPIKLASTFLALPLSEGKVESHSPTDSVRSTGINDDLNATETRIAMDNNGNTEDKLAKLEKDVSDMKQMFLELSHRVETIIQAEERRQYLGTDHVKTPFEASVICGKHKFKVQVNATMKVADLIRRIRGQRNILPSDSPNPRIRVGDIKVGHGMTLSEVGITATSEVIFSYSGSDNAAG